MELIVWVTKYSGDCMVVVYYHINYLNQIHHLEELEEDPVSEGPDAIVSKLMWLNLKHRSIFFKTSPLAALLHFNYFFNRLISWLTYHSWQEVPVLSRRELIEALVSECFLAAAQQLVTPFFRWPRNFKLHALSIPRASYTLPLFLKYFLSNFHLIFIMCITWPIFFLFSLKDPLTLTTGTSNSCKVLYQNVEASNHCLCYQLTTIMYDFTYRKEFLGK